jgi:hypothetical protein
MSLLVCNLTGTDVVISAANAKRAITVPAKVGGLTYGPPVDVTSELKGLTGGQYAALEVQRLGGGSPPLFYYWANGVPLYAVTGLTVAANLGNTVTVQATAATITPIVEARHAVFLGPAVQDLISVVNAVLPSNVALTIIANSIDYARKLQVRIVTGSTAGTLTLVGVGVDGQAVTQAIDISTSGGTRTVVTTDAYRSLTSATILGGSGFAGTVGIGLGLGLALPTQQTIVTAFGVIGANVDKLNEAVGTVDATAHTIEPTTVANGTHNYTFNYKYTNTPVSPTHIHALA